MDSKQEFQTLELLIEGAVAWISINRPLQSNALDLSFWSEFPQLLSWIDGQPKLRVAVISGAGRHFSAGIDFGLMDHLTGLTRDALDPADGRDQLRREILRLQEAFNAIERLRIPLIAAIHGACIGAGLDLIAACDLRYAAADARFCIKEVDFGVVADVGTTQRLLHVIGLPILTELSLTAATFDAEEAARIGLVGRVYVDREVLISAVKALSSTIASKPPLAIRGIKHNLLYSRDRSVAEGLEYVAGWNASMGFSGEMDRAVKAVRQRESGKSQELGPGD